MSDAPERIWAVFEPPSVRGDAPYVFASASPTKGNEYIRKDVSDALIAAALGMTGMPDEATPDARAALLKAEREKALDAAHEYLMNQYGSSPLAHPIDRKRILALMSKDKTDAPS